MRWSIPLFLAGAAFGAAPTPYGMDDGFDRGTAWGANGYSDTEVRVAISKLGVSGAQWYRGIATWGDVEPAKGAPSKTYLARQDFIYEILQTHGIQEYMQLGGQPKWASSRPDSADFWAYPPVDQAQWSAHVTFMANRFKGKINYWEIGNEEDWIFWKGDLAQYVAYLKTAYTALKAVDPANQVLLGGLASDGLTHWSPQTPGAKSKAIQQLYAAGAKGYFDIMNLHAYPATYKEWEDHIAVAYGEMAKYGDAGKRLWITETGFSTLGDAADKLKAQAAFVRAVYAPLVKHPKVDKVFWYNLRCKSGEGANEDNFGLLANDFSARPAYDTLVAVIRDGSARLQSRDANGITAWRLSRRVCDALGRASARPGRYRAPALLISD